MKNKIIMPRDLTAENGSKALLAGEFFVETDDVCHNCEGDGCNQCDDTGCEPCFVMIPWLTIKEIYATAANHFGENIESEN